MTREEHVVENEPHPKGALERAYLQHLESVVEHRDRELLLNVLACPVPADELHLLNRDFDLHLNSRNAVKAKEWNNPRTADGGGSK